MPLADVLTAVRHIILDGIELPKDRTARNVVYRERFTALSDHEIEDLAKIEPDNLRRYTESIFAAQGSILKSNFPVTFSFLDAAERETKGHGIRLRSFAKQVHAVAPWTGIHSDTLGESFCVFLEKSFCHLPGVSPAVLEMARFELACLRIRKAPNEPVRPQAGIDSTSIAALTIDELLSRPIFVPFLVTSFTSKFDLLTARDTFLASARNTPPLIEKREVRSIGARSHSYRAEWIEISEGMADALLELRGRGGTTLTDLATPFLNGQEERDEEESFKQFLALIERLTGIGAISLNLR